MKSIALLGFAFAMSPALAAAQQSPPQGATSALPHPSFAAMEQMHGQLEQIHKQARSQMLAALTPAHRILLANVVGQLAISPAPDRAVAARTLDASLSQGEARAVLSAEESARLQTHSLMEASRAQLDASLSAEQRTEMQQRMAAHEAERAKDASRPKPAPDAGRTLLDVAAGMGGEHHGFEHGGPPMGERAPQ